MDKGEPDKNGLAFLAEYSGEISSIDLMLYCTTSSGAAGVVWIGLYEGQGFTTLMGKESFTAAYTSSSTVDFSTYVFSQTYKITQGQWYTVGYSRGNPSFVVPPNPREVSKNETS